MPPELADIIQAQQAQQAPVEEQQNTSTVL